MTLRVTPGHSANFKLGDGEHLYHLRVRVTNDSAVEAHDVVVHVDAVEASPRLHPSDLVWTNTPYETTRDIHPGSYADCDVGIIRQADSKKLVLSVAHHSNGTHVLSPGAHVVRLGVSAKGVPVSRWSAEIAFKGTFSTDDDEMREKHAPMTVKQLEKPIAGRKVPWKGITAVATVLFGSGGALVWIKPWHHEEPRAPVTQHSENQSGGANFGVVNGSVYLSSPLSPGIPAPSPSPPAAPQKKKWAKREPNTAKIDDHSIRVGDIHAPLIIAPYSMGPNTITTALSPRVFNDEEKATVDGVDCSWGAVVVNESVQEDGLSRFTDQVMERLRARGCNPGPGITGRQPYFKGIRVTYPPPGTPKERGMAAVLIGGRSDVP